jgi:hypothetical protein
MWIRGFKVRNLFKLAIVGAVSATTLAMAGSAGAVVVGFGGTKLPGSDPLGDAYSTSTSGMFFDMGPEKFNTGSLTTGDGMDVATIFQFTLNNGVKNGIKLTAANTFFTDITTGKIWTPTFFTISGKTQRVTFTAPAGTFIKPNDQFQARVGFITPLDTKRYSWSANWDNTVPEPATWALMLSGFGLAGVALRRRRMSAVAA